MSTFPLGFRSTFLFLLFYEKPEILLRRIKREYVLRFDVPVNEAALVQIVHT